MAGLRKDVVRCRVCHQPIDPKWSGWFDVTLTGDTRYFHKECVGDAKEDRVRR